LKKNYLLLISILFLYATRMDRNLTRFYVLISIAITSIFVSTGATIVLAAGSVSYGKSPALTLSSQELGCVFGVLLGSLVVFTASGVASVYVVNRPTTVTPVPEKGEEL
jgi:hypothetical protein